MVVGTGLSRWAKRTSAVNRTNQHAEVVGEIDEEIVDRDHPDEALALHDRQAPQRVLAEDREGGVKVGVR